MGFYGVVGGLWLELSEQTLPESQSNSMGEFAGSGSRNDAGSVVLMRAGPSASCPRSASQEIATNTRLRWAFDPLDEFFVVYNYNVVDELDRWALEASQLLVKMQYALRW